MSTTYTQAQLCMLAAVTKAEQNAPAISLSFTKKKS
jgi:hypothetical protein